jgi:hypothetical protein
MRFILYSASTNKAGSRLLKTVRALNAHKPYLCCATIAALIEGLRKPKSSDVVAILCPSSNDDLNQLLVIRPLLRDARVILILPDGRAQTVSEGHALRPRFVSYADGDFSDVAAVVEKLAGLDTPTAGGFDERWVCSEIR